MEKKAVILCALIYFILISVYGVFITVIDKKNAALHKRRIPERRLMITAFAGGAAAMYITMKKIHHKTRHKKFMLGLPVMLLLHAALIILIFYSF